MNAFKSVKQNCSQPAVKSKLVGGLVLIDYDDFMQVIGIDPNTQPADRPKAITKRKAQEIGDLSLTTINRMIAAGRQAQAA